MKNFIKNMLVYYSVSLIALMTVFEGLIVVDKGVDVALGNFHNDFKLETIVAIIPAILAYLLSEERPYEDA